MDDETRRVNEIEQEIAETRVDLVETVEAIQERLTPSNLVSNATESVRHAASEKVRQMTDNSFMDTVRSNPIPAAMIGIGAAWMYFKGRSNGRTYDTYGSSRNWRSARGYNPGVYGETTSGDYAVGTRGSAYGSSVDAYGEAGEGVSSMGRDMTSRAREVAGDWSDSARDTSRRAQLKFNDVLRDNPLMLGAAAALIGAAIGMSIPETEAENRLMGEARDAVVDRAQNMASEAANKVSEAAGSVQQAAGKVADTASDVAANSGTSSASTPGRRQRGTRQTSTE
jgi:hypothetical protein